MKTTIRRALTLGVAIALAACDTGPYPTDPIPRDDTAGTMSATVGGQYWTASLNVQATLSNGVLTLSGTDNATQRVQFHVTGVNATGTYQVGAGSPSYGSITMGNNALYTSNLTGGSGTFTLTEFSSTHAKGTFTFTGAATPGTPASGILSVTAGAFNVKLN